MTERTNSIYTRVTPQEKQRIASRARRCGLSLSEYIRQRCLGYAPREIPPDVYYDLCAKLDAPSWMKLETAETTLLCSVSSMNCGRL